MQCNINSHVCLVFWKNIDCEKFKQDDCSQDTRWYFVFAVRQTPSWACGLKSMKYSSGCVWQGRRLMDVCVSMGSHTWQLHEVFGDVCLTFPSPFSVVDFLYQICVSVFWKSTAEFLFLV